MDLSSAVLHYLPFHGPVAQLIERFVRNEEVVGLIPIGSTNVSRCETLPAVANAKADLGVGVASTDVYDRASDSITN